MPIDINSNLKNELEPIIRRNWKLNLFLSGMTHKPTMATDMPPDYPKDEKKRNSMTDDQRWEQYQKDHDLPKPKSISKILKEQHGLSASGNSGGIWNDLTVFNEFIRVFPKFFVSETRGADTNTYFLSDEGIRFRNQLREQINTLIHTLNTLPFPEGDSWANLERNEDE